MNDPIVSVVMSVYNGGVYLAKAIESVLSQTFTNFEFIIINDGSTDGSVDVINFYADKDKRIKIISRENQGLAISLNEGIDLAKGEYIARMDADDKMYPTRIARQVDYMEKNISTTVVGGGQMMYFQDGSKKINRPPLRSNSIKAGLFVRTTMLHPTVMMRKAFLDRNNIKYFPDYYLCEDYKIFVDLLLAGAEFANLPEIVNTYGYRDPKGWDRYEESMVRGLRNIWVNNLRHISIQAQESDILCLLRITNKVSVNSLTDVFGIGLFFLKCLIKSNSTFGGKSAFFYMSLKTFVSISKKFLKNTIVRKTERCK